MKDDGTVDGAATTRHIRAKKALQRPFVILKIILFPPSTSHGASRDFTYIQSFPKEPAKSDKSFFKGQILRANRIKAQTCYFSHLLSFLANKGKASS